MTTKQNKGFTLLEILLVIAAIGILAAIVLVAINPNRQIAQARNTVRQADINTIQKAVEQYLIEKGSYPNGITNTYREICNTGSNNNTQGTVSNECIDLRELVPDYIASIPVNPSTSTHSGYYAWINDINNKVAVLAGKGENGKVIGVNHLKENIVTDGLVLNLDAGNLASYPGTGNTWFDLSGNNNNGTLVNGVGYDPTNGGALSFDGVNDYVELGGTARYFTSYINQQITIETWVYIPSSATWTNGFYGNILTRGFFGGSHGLFRTTTNNQVSAWFRQTGAFVGGGQVESTGTIERDKWTQLVAVWKAPGSVLYINGQVSSQNSTALVDVNATATDDLWYMGRNTSASGNSGNYFTGNQSVFRIYNRSLTPEEIAQNYNTTKGRFGL
jgi:prepilin-type N-terminal cleavage/methylation domain-containing protein